MGRLINLIAILVPLVALTSSATVPLRPLPQEAYVWQRLWTPAVLSALQRSSDAVPQWRVLVAETDRGGTLRTIAVNWNALRATARPVIAVIRIDGSLLRWNEAALLAQIGALAGQWRTRSIPISGIEIDYDCGTAQLSAYAHFLKRLRALPRIPRRISITALPAWMSSRALEEVIDSTDESVLQVHAVRAPEEGLFDSVRARAWIDAFDARTARPFRVSLPDYGVRVVWSDDGTMLAVESEMPKLMGGTRSTALAAMPREIARLLRDLERAPPSHLAGIVWFRLPTDDDSLTWSAGTWRAVMRGDELRTVLAVTPRATDTPGLTDITLVNKGEIDAELPRAVALPPDCRLADGVNGYALDHSGSDIFLRRLQTALLRAHHERTIGWMRCSPGEFDVRP